MPSLYVSLFGVILAHACQTKGKPWQERKPTSDTKRATAQCDSIRTWPTTTCAATLSGIGAGSLNIMTLHTSLPCIVRITGDTLQLRGDVLGRSRRAGGDNLASHIRQLLPNTPAWRRARAARTSEDGIICSTVAKKSHQSMAEFRLSSQKLRIETGKHKRPRKAREDRMCIRCRILSEERAPIDDEHYLLFD
jgi:hypothetical protein